MNEMKKVRFSDTTDESTSGTGKPKKEVVESPREKTDEEMNQNPNELLGNDTESEKPEGVDEAKWKEAKEKATSEYGYSQDNPRYWKIVQGIYEKIENASKLSRLSEKGRIKWWDRRDKEGIIVDAKGNEYYFNASTLKYGNPDDGKSVEFQPTEHGGTSTASNVKVI